MVTVDTYFPIVFLDGDSNVTSDGDGAQTQKSKGNLIFRFMYLCSEPEIRGRELLSQRCVGDSARPTRGGHTKKQFGSQ